MKSERIKFLVANLMGAKIRISRYKIKGKPTFLSVGERKRPHCLKFIRTNAEAPACAASPHPERGFSCTVKENRPAPCRKAFLRRAGHHPPTNRPRQRPDNAITPAKRAHLPAKTSATFRANI
ncbi:MAG: hypothetical protein K2H92_10360 [Bacteroidaceae bacterium]|nr:hypothetical protein [Bacteroidaceae bacterium]